MPSEREKAAAKPHGRGTAPESLSLSREVHTLTNVIKQLEEQLEEMLATNDTLRKAQEEERERRLELQRKLDELHERLRRSEQLVVDRENVLAEVEHLGQERARLLVASRVAGERVKELELQREQDQRSIERLRAAHRDAVEEVQSVEAQFERAMQLVARTKAQLAVACDERDQHSARHKASEALLSELRRERDALLAEVEQSRAALDEIRRSLVDACAVSTGASRDEESAP